jgi:hypothetical protein
LALPDRAGEKAGQREDMDVDDALASERIQIERKQFFFDLKENAQGRFLKITEDVSGRRNTIIVPSTGLGGFRDTLDKIIEAEEENSAAGDKD